MGSDEPHVGSRIHGVTMVEHDLPTIPLLQAKPDVSPSTEYIQDISSLDIEQGFQMDLGRLSIEAKPTTG